MFIGNGAVFVVSYKKGSREFGTAEKFSLALLVISTVIWLVLQEPYIGLVMSLVAHFIGGIPTIVRVAKRPDSEQAYYWYFFFAASLLSIITSDKSDIKAVVFPIYFACFDGLIIILANRKRITNLSKQ